VTELVSEELVGELVSQLEDCCSLAVVGRGCEKPGTIQKPRGRGMSAIGRYYQATASEDMTVDTNAFVCNSEL
jgi:hypothetical protein